MKNRIQTALFHPGRIIIFLLLFFYCFSAKANNYNNNKITIDAGFETGDLGNIISTLHANLSDINYLTIKVGTLNNADVFWIRDSLVNLLTLKIWDEAHISDSSLPDNAFKNHINIQSCYFENVTSVGDNAFINCLNLSDVRFIELTQIGDSAFAGCSLFWKLKTSSAEAPEVGEGAFEDCHFYRQFRLPYEGSIACQTVDDGNIADNYWYGFELLVPFENEVTIDKTFTTGELSTSVSALRSDLSAITKLTITKGILNNTDVYWIRDSLPNLEILTINEDASFSEGNVPDNAFKNLSHLQYAVIPNVTFIGNNAFENCTNLVTVRATSATSLGGYAFKNCINCNQLFLNKYSPPSVAIGTFEGCTANRKIIDLGHSNYCDPAAYRAVNDGNTGDNYWYGWEIQLGGTTIIAVCTDKGGNLDWGVPSAWDTIYENVNGALFWNGNDWIANDTYGHMYFEDLRVTGLRIGNYGGINYPIPADTTIGIGRIISGYIISVSEYAYNKTTIDSGTYTYSGIKYSINQPDGTTIDLYSRGNGNGTDSAYFDIVLEDNSPGPGITTLREGGVVSDASGFTLEEAINNPLVDSLVMGRLVTTKLTNHENRYFIDTNGGHEMGGMSYILGTTFLPHSQTMETYELAKTYINEFSVNFKNNEGQLESFTLVPLLKSETYNPYIPTNSDRLSTTDENEIILFPNPVSDKLHLKISSGFITGNLMILDIHGRLVYSSIAFLGNNLDVSGFIPGFYYLQLETEGRLYYSKFIKE